MRAQMSKTEAEEVLRLPEHYSKADLRRCYADLAREYHPDVARRNGHSEQEAEERMAQINVAYDCLLGFFDGGDDQVLHRGLWESAVGGSGIENGFGQADWRSGVDGAAGWGSGPVHGAEDDDFWNFATDEEDAPAEEPVPVTPRTVLLGPVVPRVALVAYFAWVWWNSFALLPQNAASYPFPGTDVAGWARLLSAVVYPTYLVVYEAVTGNISGVLRAVLNAGFSWIVRRYYDLRPKTASYGCELSKMVKNQIWALLMIPAVVWLAALAQAATGTAQVLWGVLAVALGVDTLAACVRGGLVNTWTSALSEQIERAYLVLRRRLLMHCGQWRGRQPGV